MASLSTLRNTALPAVTGLALIFLLAACGSQSDSAKVVDEKSTECPTKDDGTATRVLIIGDSISAGYSAAVVESLCGANIYATRVSGAKYTSAFIVANLDKWLGTQKWDLIVLNEGLADIPGSTEEGDKFIPALNSYKENLKIIATKISAQAYKAIFLTTTYISPKCWYYFTGDEVDFNTTAKDALVDFPVFTIIDFYWKSYLLRNEQNADGFHFTANGYKDLGKFVSDSILEKLSEP